MIDSKDISVDPLASLPHNLCLSWSDGRTEWQWTGRMGPHYRSGNFPGRKDESDRDVIKKALFTFEQTLPPKFVRDAKLYASATRYYVAASAGPFASNARDLFGSGEGAEQLNVLRISVEGPQLEEVPAELHHWSWVARSPDGFFSGEVDMLHMALNTPDAEIIKSVSEPVSRVYGWEAYESFTIAFRVRRFSVYQPGESP